MDLIAVNAGLLKAVYHNSVPLTTLPNRVGYYPKIRHPWESGKKMPVDGAMQMTNSFTNRAFNSANKHPTGER